MENIDWNLLGDAVTSFPFVKEQIALYVPDWVSQLAPVVDIIQSKSITVGHTWTF